jgi:2-dehydro-3-deoxygluconokinase
MMDLDKLIDGYDLIHLTGITPALSGSLQTLTLKLMKQANEQHIPVSFNFRQTLWSKEDTRAFFTDAM